MKEYEFSLSACFFSLSGLPVKCGHLVVTTDTKELLNELLLNTNNQDGKWSTYHYLGLYDYSFYIYNLLNLDNIYILLISTYSFEIQNEKKKIH